jgi:hypothetical protein
MSLFFKFPQIQLPKFSNLIKAIFICSTPYKLSTYWCNNDDSFQWFSRSAWSIYYIILIKKILTNKDTIIIWLPDYFCNETLNYARTLKGVNFYFYRINADMSPNFDDFFKNDILNKPDILLFVQYFGNHYDAKILVNFCKIHKIWIIEDAAHALIPNKHIGEYGDFVLFSPHKLLPIPDGSIMVLKKNGPSNLLNNKSFLYLFEENQEEFFQFKYFNKNTLIWYTKKLLQHIGLKTFIKHSDFEITLQSNETNKFHKYFSIISQKILNYEILNLNKIIKTRAKNQTTWEILLKKIITKISFEIIQNNGISYLLGIKFNNKEDCITIYNSFIKSGIPITHWPDLPNEVIQNQNWHSKAIQLRNTCLFLPLHANVDFTKIENLTF